MKAPDLRKPLRRPKPDCGGTNLVWPRMHEFQHLKVPCGSRKSMTGGSNLLIETDGSTKQADFLKIAYGGLLSTIDLRNHPFTSYEAKLQ